MPIDMIEGNMLFLALYQVFVMKFPARECLYLKNQLLNLLLEWDLSFNIENALFTYVNNNLYSFEDECQFYKVEESDKIYESLALLKIIKKLKLPFPCIYDPLGIAFNYIMNMEKEKGIEVEMISVIDQEGLDEANLKVPENKVFKYYLDRLEKNENTFEKISRCMENGIPIIFKDVDVKTITLIDSLIQWRFKKYCDEIKNSYYKKKFFRQESYSSSSGSMQDLKNESDKMSQFSSERLDSSKWSQDDDQYESINFNKAPLMIKKNFRIYLVFSNQNFQNIDNFYRQRTTFINMSVEEDELVLKDLVLHMLLSQFQYEPFVISQILKGNTFKNYKINSKAESQFFQYWNKKQTNFREQAEINEIKRLLKVFRDNQYEKLKFVLESPSLRKYKALFEKVQQEIEEEEKKEREMGKDKKKKEHKVIQVNKSEERKPKKKGKKNPLKSQSFNNESLLQFFIKQPSHIQNKFTFEKIYKEILDNNANSLKDFRKKILFAAEPIFLLWRTLQKIRSSLGPLYNYSDNFFKLII